MSTYKTQGVIIKRSNFGEASLMLNIYTKDFGKIKVVAKSARKEKGKLKGHLELFLLTDLVLVCGRNIDIIASSVTIESFLNLRNDLKISFGAYYIIELADKMTIEGHKDERVFYLLKRVLLFLDVETKYYITSEMVEIVVLLFQIQLLGLSGFLPEIDKCVVCSSPIKPGKNNFSFSLGGVVGSECIATKISSTGDNPFFISGKNIRENSHSLIFIDNNTIKLLRLFQFKGNNLKEYNLYLEKSFKIIKKLKVNKKLILDSIFLIDKFIEFNIEKKVEGVDFLNIL